MGGWMETRLRGGKVSRLAWASGMLLLLALGFSSTFACSSSGGDELDGTSWKLSGWSISSLNSSDFEITAAFSDGRISGKAAVNTYGGSYSAGAITDGKGEFSVGALALTKMAGPEPAMRAEYAFTELLSQVGKYSLADEILTLYDANGNELLIFEKSG
jgi:heat shock protein HslJ